jgi:hypothetical protein
MTLKKFQFSTAVMTCIMCQNIDGYLSNNALASSSKSKSFSFCWGGFPLPVIELNIDLISPKQPLSRLYSIDNASMSFFADESKDVKKLPKKRQYQTAHYLKIERQPRSNK